MEQLRGCFRCGWVHPFSQPTHPPGGPYVYVGFFAVPVLRAGPLSPKKPTCVPTHVRTHVRTYAYPGALRHPILFEGMGGVLLCRAGWGGVRFAHRYVRTYVRRTFTALFVLGGARVHKAARNATGHIQRKENEVSGMLKIHSVATAMQEGGKPVDWGRVRRMVLRNRPPYSDVIDGLIAFVAARSGGLAGQHLQHVRCFHNNWVNPSVRTSVAPALYPVLADSKWHYVALAIWQAAYTCPAEFVRNGCCSWVTASEVTTSLRGKPDDLNFAEKCLASWRTGRKDAGFEGPVHSDNKLLSVYVKSDVAMGRYLLGKQEASKTQYSDVPAVNRYFVGLLRESFPNATVNHFWTEEFPEHLCVKPAAPATVTPGVASGQLRIHEVGEDGILASGVGLLQQKGFDIGSIVQRVGVSGHFQVASAGDTAVVLQGLGNEKNYTASVAYDVFLKSYQLGKAADVEERIADWEGHAVFSIKEARLLAAKGLVLSSLAVAFEQATARSPVTGQFELLIKPARKLRALKDIPTGGLLLTPDTVSIKVEASADGVVPTRGCGFAADGTLQALVQHRLPDGSLQHTFPEHTFCLNSSTSEKGLAPFWFVTASSDKKAVNVAWDWLVVTAVTGTEWDELPVLPRVVREEPPAKIAKKKKEDTAASAKGKAKAKAKEEVVDTAEDDIRSTAIYLPVLVNAKPITAGSFLVCYKPPADAKPRQVEAIQPSKLSKGSS